MGPLKGVDNGTIRARERLYDAGYSDDEIAPWVQRPSEGTERSVSELSEAESELSEAESELSEAESELSEAESELSEAESELSEAESDIRSPKL